MRFRVHGSSGGETDPRPPGVVGRVVASMFFGFFLALGLFFTVQVARSVGVDWRIRSWEPVEARIVDSQVDREPGGEGNYVFRTAYAYEVSGRPYRATRVRPGYSGSSSAAEAQALAHRYPHGASVTVLVDPADPAEATLERRSAAYALIVLFPLIFVAVGAGGILLAWTAGPRRRAISSVRPAGARSARAASVVFVLFLVGGAAGSWFLLYLPVSRLVRARSWPAVPTTVVSSEVRSHDSDDGTTYSVDILYRYEFAGREWISNRYGFLEGSSSGRRAKARIVRRYPAGSETVCFVDPDRPDYAVLDRSLRAVYLVGLFPLAFLVIGAGGLVWSRRKASNTDPARDDPTRHAAGHSRSASGAGTLAAGELTLRPRHSAAVKVLGVLFFALFWNGIVSVFVWQVVDGWRSGQKPVFLTVFLAPFVAVGLVALLLVVHQVLAAANPRPMLILRGGRIEPGARLDLEWRTTGRAKRVSSVRIVLEGREEATYTRGTDTHTARHTFFERIVFESDLPSGAAYGQARLELPREAPPTFDASRNKIVWALRFRGSIARWPDVDERFPIQVEPPRTRVREEIGA